MVVVGGGGASSWLMQAMQRGQGLFAVEAVLCGEAVSWPKHVQRNNGAGYPCIRCVRQPCAVCARQAPTRKQWPGCGRLTMWCREGNRRAAEGRGAPHQPHQQHQQPMQGGSLRSRIMATCVLLCSSAQPYTHSSACSVTALVLGWYRYWTGFTALTCGLGCLLDRHHARDERPAHGLNDDVTVQRLAD